MEEKSKSIQEMREAHGLSSDNRTPNETEIAAGMRCLSDIEEIAKEGEVEEKVELKIVFVNRTETLRVLRKDALKEARYLIKRHIEKEHNYATDAYIVLPENKLDVASIIDGIKNDHEKYEREIKEQEERALLKKLQEKYKS
jgi:hypothetical protein